MSDKYINMIHINKTLFIILVVIIMIIIFVQFVLLTTKCIDSFTSSLVKSNNFNFPNSRIQPETQEIQIAKTTYSPQLLPQLPPPTIPFAPDVPRGPPMYPLTDPVKIYDYQKMNDPLEEPTKRVDRYLLGPVQYRRLFNYPVRGDPDNPRWLGLLICETDDDKSNKLIKLFGRQKYPRSDHYEYYTMVNVGHDQVKVRLHRKKELYDDDQVTIPEINKTFKVKLNKDDDTTYNPYF